MENKIEYLKLFTTSEDYNSFVDSDTTNTPYIALCEDTEEVYFNTKKDTAGIEYVDLGLPNGTLWAKMNVGAAYTNDYGMLFTWGGVEGAEVSMDGNGEFQFGTEYTFGTNGNMIREGFYIEAQGGWQQYTKGDNFTKLQPKHDTARYHMGGSWHLPSKAQVQELIDNCDSVLVEVSPNVTVMRYTSKINGKYVDFPNCGYATKDGMQTITDNQLYLIWTNELSDVYDTDAFILGANEILATRRENGLFCRGVIG